VRPVTGVERWSALLSDAFVLHAVAVPGDRDFSEGVWACERDAVIVPAESGHLWCRVSMGVGSGLVAWAIFGAGRSSVQCCEIEGHEDVRRKGVASALYRSAACFFQSPTEN